jgi:hypothetical protein
VKNIMPKLNQVIAIEDGTKKTVYADLSKTHQILQKPDLFNGSLATYKPKDETGEPQPDQRKAVQQNARELVNLTKNALVDMWV